MKKIPMRSCVVTREKCEKRDLIRIVKNKEGAIFIDKTGKANGRGAYLKKDSEVIKKCQKQKTLNKVFETDVPDSLFTEILKELNE